MIDSRLLSLSTTRIARGNKSVIEEIPTYNSKGLATGLELRVPEYKASGLESFRENLSDSQSYAAQALPIPDHSDPSEKIGTTNIAPVGSMRLFDGVLEEFYIQQMRMTTKTSKLIPKNTPEWDEKMKSIEEKLLKQCETGLTRRLALTSGSGPSQ